MYQCLKDELKDKGLSVQGQNSHQVGTLIGQRGDQSINRNAKTSGGISGVSSNESAVLKWCLNMAEQAKNTQTLYDFCGLGKNAGIYKPCRPSQILRSEKLVTNIILKCLEQRLYQPF